MTHILVLTAEPGAAILREAPLARIEELIGDLAEAANSQRWLAPDDAWQITLTLRRDADPAGSQPGIEAILHDVRTGLGSLPIDANMIAQAGTQRRKKLLIADMDSTIINQECIDEIADFAGVKDRVSDITHRAMAGELDFEAALRQRVALLTDLGEDKLCQVFDERLTLMPGARTLVQTMRAHGAFCALVSGGFSYFTSRIAAKVGFHVNQANELKIAGGKLTGEVGQPILGRQAKLDALHHYISERGLDAAATLAVGDGANDLAMIKAAGLGVAYRAKPIVAAEADCGITHGDLTALLYLQGYRRDEFVSD